MRLLEEINSRGTTVLVVSHNMEIVEAMGKRVITLQQGHVVSDTKIGGAANEN
jgi:cell division transport system ATP-binding protein